MSETNTAFEISVIEASLSLLNDNEKMHQQKKQNIKSRIAKIKQEQKPKKIDFMAEYQDLIEKLSPLFSSKEKPIMLFKPHQTGIISPLKNYKTFPALQINPVLCRLNYADFEKTALILYADDITAYYMVNPKQAKDFAEVYQSVKQAKFIQRNKFYCLYDMEEFKQIRTKVFKNFNKIVPNFQALCQSFYLQNKNNRQELVSLTPYQRYCLVNDPKYIFDAGKPDIRHDMDIIGEQINQTLALFRQPQRSFKENLIAQIEKSQKHQ